MNCPMSESPKARESQGTRSLGMEKVVPDHLFMGSQLGRPT